MYLPITVLISLRDLDEEKRRRISLMSRSEVEMIEQQHLYSKWLAKARETDLSDIARLGMIYVSGIYKVR